MAGAGKGSKPRKVNFEKFSRNYDRIFSKGKPNSVKLAEAK